MKVLRFLLEKEFRQIFRDPAILRIIFMLPAVQLIVFPLAANYEVKNISITVVDNDHSTYSRRFINEVTASGYFKLAASEDSYNHALEQVEKDQSDLVLEIPQNFERNLIKENSSPLFIAVNAINGVRANLGSAYLLSMIRDFNNDIRIQWIQSSRFSPQPQIETIPSFWYNTHMKYYLFMVPGILALLLTMVGAFLSALNIVKEKEVGTIEQINVTPIKKYHFILGKLVPFWILGLVVLTIGLTVMFVVYGIFPKGNIGVIYLFASIYLLAVLGLGLLISTYANTQQQAMLIAFFIMMVFILLGGLYTSVDSMPRWAQIVTMFNPIKYFIEVMRMVTLKGSGIMDLKNHFMIMIAFAVVLNTWAVLNYRKQN